jgi:hypothetical protein
LSLAVHPGVVTAAALVESGSYFRARLSGSEGSDKQVRTQDSSAEQSAVIGVR